MTGGGRPARGTTLLVLPGRRTRSAGIDARSIAAAGFAEGLRDAGSDVVWLDVDGPRDAETSTEESVRGVESASRSRSLVRRLPAAVRPAVGDLAALRADREIAKRLRSFRGGRFSSVMQFHHRFQRAAFDFADRARIPLVLRVEALEVQEEASWGVRRPGYGSMVQRKGETDLLRRANLVLPVSTQVDRSLAMLGVPDDRRLVVPNGVDVRLFAPGPPDPEVRSAIGVGRRFTVGWIGGFRPFHGLEMLRPFVAALRAQLPDAVVCLLGAGPLRSELEHQAREMDDVVVAGPASHLDVPAWIRSFDACVLFSGAGPFHYSPMKVLEYMACGRPVIVPDVGDLGRDLRDGHDAILVPPADAAALAAAVVRVASDAELAQRLGQHARLTIEAGASWEVRARAILERIAGDARLQRAGGSRG